MSHYSSGRVLHGPDLGRFVPILETGRRAAQSPGHRSDSSADGGLSVTGMGSPNRVKSVLQCRSLDVCVQRVMERIRRVI